MKKISIIIPSLNQGEYIERTITSLLDQNYPNLEIIVMDGGSSDQTISILRKFETKLTWVSEKDHGQANAINRVHFGGERYLLKVGILMRNWNM